MFAFRRSAPPRHARPGPPRRRAARAAIGGLLLVGVGGALLVPAVSARPAARPQVFLADTATGLRPSAGIDVLDADVLPDRAPAVLPSRASRARPAAGRPTLATGGRPLAAARPATARPRVHVGPRWVRPVAAAVNSPYGQRWGRPHRGIDFGSSSGSPIVAIGDGVVVGVGYQAEEGGYGQITLVRHAGGVVSAYAHQSRMVVNVGDRVRAGQLLGYVGSTGHVTGPHLHFEIRTSLHGGQVNPRTWLRAHGVLV